MTCITKATVYITGVVTTAQTMYILTGFLYYCLWSWPKICDTLPYLLGTIFITCDPLLYRQIVGIPMSTYCAPLCFDVL